MLSKIFSANHLLGGTAIWRRRWQSKEIFICHDCDYTEQDQTTGPPQLTHRGFGFASNAIVIEATSVQINLKDFKTEITCSVLRRRILFGSPGIDYARNIGGRWGGGAYGA